MGAKCIDLTGQRYGMLVAVERVGTDAHRQALWRCKCDCGTETVVRAGGLRSGNTRSCGCGSGFKQQEKNPSFKTGHSHSRLYRIWEAMKTRCYNKNCKAYKDYGARGISVCGEWLHDFAAFYEWAMQNGYQGDLSIDRIKVNEGYSPGNCRWATPAQQSKNTRRNVLVSINGETRLLGEWAEAYGINYQTMATRYYRDGLKGADLIKPVRRRKSS